jgi:putative DNA primase/helicase
LSGIDEAERARLRERWAIAQRAEGEKREKRQQFAARRAGEQWKSARAELPAGVRCPYLEKKGIAHENGAFRYFIEGELATLVVPMVRYDVKVDAQDPQAGRQADRRLVALQRILPDGTKRFTKGGNPVGAACLLGKPPRDGQPIAFVEGAATGGSVRAALDREVPVVVCFTAGNLLPVARIYRALYPTSPFLFCADDDAYLEAQLNNRLRGDFDASPWDLYKVADGERCVGQDVALGKQVSSSPTLLVRGELVEDERGVPGLLGFIEVAGGRRHTFGLSNAGRTKANEAAQEVGNSWVCYPLFAKRELSPDPAAARLTDFNDLHAAEGLEVARKQLREAIALIAIPSKKTALEKEQDRARREKEREAKSEAKRRAQAIRDARLADVLKRYVLIYPTREAWDTATEEIVKLEHVGALYGSAYVDDFTHNQRKRVVHVENVVFDPRGPIDQLEDDRINLFRGIEMEPDKDASCEKLKALLFYLCNDDVEVYRWVMRWLALPLKRLGSKMATSLVIHGEQEGTGKNLFFGAIAEIYGRHGGFITQRQLESDFNTWQSAKLFMVANEVVTRAEMRHQAGYVRHLITEPKIWINKKMQNEREEANHMNLTFLSNENQPLLVPRHDRRFVVIRTPDKLPKDRYSEVVAELANGGARALYWHLLHEIELGDFHTHSEPIETAAKLELIEQGLSSPQLFWQDFHEGEFPLPYEPCLREDLYRAYLAWCARNGEKMPKRINVFMPEFRSMNGVRFDRRLVNVDGKRRLRRVAIMNNDDTKCPDGVEEDEWVELAARDFSTKLDAISGGGRP